MSHYVVLVKQVPDVTQITDNAFDPKTGNLMRGRLSTVINELDAQALAFADRMRQTSGDQTGKVVALTMGPPMAEEVLRYALARRADLAVLLTDKDLGGADTYATANPLAHAVRRIARELFAGSDDYYLVCGMQSVDGDTAQVPAQVAQELQVPCVAYATDVAWRDGRFEFTRIISGGSQLVAPRRTPAVITVAKYEYPLFTTVPAARRARALPVLTWGAQDIQATAIGVQGSKTRVIRVFPPPKTSRKCRRVADIKTLARLIVESYSNPGVLEVGRRETPGRRYLLPRRRTDPFDRGYEGLERDAQTFTALTGALRQLGVKTRAEINGQTKAALRRRTGWDDQELDELLAGLGAAEPKYGGEVWVVGEQDGDALHASTLELIGKARGLADSLEAAVGVLLAGAVVERLAPDLIAAGADKVYLLEHPLLAEFEPGLFRRAVAEGIEEYWPQIVLFGATPQGRVLAPMVSYRLHCGLTADCTGLEVRDHSRKAEIALLHQTRPALGGNVMATICTKDSRSQMATARPGVMKRLPPDAARRGRIIRHDVRLSDADRTLDILRTDKARGGVNLDAEVIVSGGRGLQTRENYQRLLEGLCTSISTRLDAPVERGASRGAVEQGFADRARQVGQTGTAVAPRVYLALGISGAIQHMIGVQNSQTIIAVNRDANAPVFHQCDYYLVGNVEDVVPGLIQELGAADAPGAASAGEDRARG